MARSESTYDAGQPWREEAPAPATPLPQINLAAFSAEVDALHARLKSRIGADDLAHLKKMERWGRTCTVLGYALAWMFPNPVAALLIGLGNVARWSMPTHHVMHRGYDAVPGVPARYQSRHYAMGARRWVDWMDWLYPPAWAHEHNHLHHYHTGQREDPDLVEHNAWILRLQAMPRPLKWLLVAVLMTTWKLSYYAPNTYWAWKQNARIRTQTAAEARENPLPTPGNIWRIIVPGERLWWPFTRWGLEFQLRCVLPYALLRFGLIPALFLPLGTTAWLAVLVNSLLAEVVANVWSFAVIAPNHAGDDLHRYDGGCRGRAEFQLQQVMGSVNYPGGSDLRDFLQGYLNYQIEHHVWPDLPLLKYREAAPELKAICQRHGVPYVEESVFRRFGKLWAILMGDARMRRVDMLAERARAIPMTEGRQAVV